MRDDIDHRPSSAPSRRARRRRVWAAVAAAIAAAAGGLFAARRAGGPELARYRLERVDRGPIRDEVTVPGTVSAADLAPGRPAGGRQSRTRVQVTLSEPDVARVAVGEGATLRCQADPERERTGTVSELRPIRAGADGRAYRALVETDNRDQTLRPGTKATVVIEVARRDAVLRLPVRALGFAPPGMEPTAPAAPHVGRVFVLDHGVPRAVRVTVGLRDRVHAELVAGPLREGDAVIVGRAEGLRRD